MSNNCLSAGEFCDALWRRVCIAMSVLNSAIAQAERSEQSTQKQDEIALRITHVDWYEVSTPRWRQKRGLDILAGVPTSCASGTRHVL